MRPHRLANRERYRPSLTPGFLTSPDHPLAKSPDLHNCPIASAVILFLYSANFGCICEAGSHPPPRIVPATWRVVFSSSGDLAPACVAVRNYGLRSRMWIDKLRRPLRSRPLVRLSRIPVCGDCLSFLAPADVNACSICGEALEFTPTEADVTCSMCRRAHPGFDFAISFGSYDGALRRLVHLLKYEPLKPAANILGEKLAEAISFRNLVSEDPILVVPVPLHKAKRRQRRCNQSELLARSALRYLDRSRFELDAGNLRRVRATVSQKGLTRHQRRENVRGAFLVTAPERVLDRTVLIVDDVYTTGTTLNECARVLRAAGVKQVVVVATVARVYRSVPTMVPGGMFMQEENAAVLAGAVAG